MEEEAVLEKSKPKINIKPKGVSAYSISSLKTKKEIEERKKAATLDEVNLPEDIFEEASMQKHWED